MLRLNPTFDTQKDVVSSVLAKEETVRGNIGVLEPRILNVERDGGVLYSWRGASGTTRIGKYDPHKTENKLLYTFDKQVCVSSCSLNKEETLLAVSLSQTTQEGGRLKPVSKCLTLLIEIHPINNTKVLKAVDCRVKVQFLYPKTCRTTVMESHILLVAEDGYVDQYHITLTRQEGYRVVMLNPERLGRDRVAEEFNWVQWDSDTQRLFYLTSREKHTLKCVQFYPERNFETVFELPLEMPSLSSVASVRFVNFGYDHYEELNGEDGLRLEVFTDAVGTMCVCYSHPVRWNKDATYTIAFVHRGCSKTFTASLEKGSAPANEPRVHPIFIHLGYYIAVYLAGHFLHLINCRHQDLLCYSLFLSGADGDIEALGSGCEVISVSGRRLLDVRSGRMYTMELNHDFVLELLSSDRPEAQRLAALHCLLVYLQPNPVIELKIINWITENVMSFDAFDQIQEFILASLYRMSYQQCVSLDKVLPYSCVIEKKELPVALTAIPEVKCTPELLCQPLIKGKAKSLHGYWEELHHVLDRMRYFEAVPGPRFRTALIKEDWTKYQAAMQNQEKKKSLRYNRNIEENTKKVLSMVDTWRLDRRVVPLFQEEDQQQRAQVGLMVDKLREHLNRHLPRLGKKKIDLLVVNYAAKLLELVWHLLELMWQKLELGPWVLCLKQQGSSEEWAMFHMMFRILEATKGLCFPLPPGYSTLLSVLGVRCLPRHTFLQYVDHGLLQLTEPFVSRLMTDLDNSDANEQLKFSILKRLPECMEKVRQQWDHPITSACISREYVRTLLEKYPENRDSISLDHGKTCFHPEFLPLNYLAKILADREEQALNPFEEEENVDARFVEETALKQTLIKLGFEVK
ncbi:gamma-secretase-activating protein isoform X1 [Triplophysa rosa]|uniref:gamma-secretase-activating protein isoform X1 n=1 Tax=Triplophysa rosa TaxID=992332 RepID=UPI002545F1BB|nr:gamma-secretase-activating protein isoform X1 [Triplophysa rosa]